MSQSQYNGMSDVEEVKILSSSLFGEVKASCVELSKLSLDPTVDMQDSRRAIEDLLRSIIEHLDRHRDTHRGQGFYVLSAGVGDYIFFPLSGILKRSGLGEGISGKILYILGFLMEHSWKYVGDMRLVEQLFPLVVVLCERDGEGRPQINIKGFDFIRSVVYCLKGLVSMVPGGYFAQDSKKLGLLGDSTMILLDVLKSFTNPAVEQVEVVNNVLYVLITLCEQKLTPEQMSFIFPGTISSLVNFFTTSRNLHFSIIVNILKLMETLIVKVFSDDDLKAEFETLNTQKDLSGLSEMWESQKSKDETNQRNFHDDEFKVDIQIGSNDSHRTKSWLTATATQLKISLNVFFKNLLISSNVNKLKIQTKPQIRQQVLSFAESIQKSCFISLFNTLEIMLIDVLSIVVDLASKDDPDMKVVLLDEFGSIICLNHIEDARKNNKLEHLQKILDVKMKELIEDKLPSIILSSDEEKILTYLSSIELYFTVLHKIVLNLSLGEDKLKEKKLLLIRTFRSELINALIFRNVTKKDTKSILSILQGNENNTDSSNQLNSIELPPHVNVNKLVKLNPESKGLPNKRQYTSDLKMLVNDWRNSSGSLTSQNRHQYFSLMYSSSVENGFTDMFKFICKLGFDNANILEFVESVFQSISNGNSGEMVLMYESISLWFINMLMNTSSTASHTLTTRGKDHFDINEFINFSAAPNEDMEEDPEFEEVTYLVLSKSQQIVDRLSETILEPEKLSVKRKGNGFNIQELSYCIALDSLGSLAKCMAFDDFRNDVLIDYLYPLIESLTIQSSPKIQAKAKATLQTITDEFYQGSLEMLIVDNSDYLIDCINLKLASSQITPSLSGILLIILRIAGVQMIKTNQLNDVITEIFLLIDSYHGYSVLLEGFFIVFEELLNIVSEAYKDSSLAQLEDLSSNTSAWKPWGMNNIHQLLKLIADSEKITERFEGYDSTKEYFKNPEKPFGDTDSLGDSDDEDEDSGPEEGTAGNTNQDTDEDQNKWDCYLPKEIYMTVQKILSYGFLILSHPSFSLKAQILKTLKKAYPILAGNYDLVLPVISTNWSVLLTLISGSDTVSTLVENQSSLTHERENLILPALALAIEIIERDSDERFLAKQFMDSWEFLVNHSKVFTRKKQNTSRNNALVLSSNNQALITNVNPNVIKGYVHYFLRGLCIYERRVPEKLAYQMVRFCHQVGIPHEIELTRDVNNIIWVIENTN